MSYHIYMGQIQMPVPPEELHLKVENKNETISLLSGNTANILKKPGLTEISFTLLLPNQSYPFLDAPIFHPAEYYLNLFEDFKTNQKAFHFVVTRIIGNGESDDSRLFGTDMLVSLEEYKIQESADLGYDCKVDITLKQYVPFSSKRAQQIRKDSSGKITAIVESVPSRDDTKEKIRSYTANGKETLWEIACIVYGYGEWYEYIYKANANILDSKSGVVPEGTILMIPWRW